VALQAVRGIDLIAAVGVLAEIGDLSRFQNPRELMGYTVGACWRANSCTSPMTLGRPPGLPLWPLRNFNFLLSVTVLFSGNIIAQRSWPP
jgi:hypothetical protein